MAEGKKKKNCYQLLGVVYGATSEQVDEAYTNACSKFEQEESLTPQEAHLWEQIQQARHILLNPTLRQSYDHSMVDDPLEFLQNHAATQEFTMVSEAELTEQAANTSQTPESEDSNASSKVTPRRVRKGTLTSSRGITKPGAAVVPKNNPSSGSYYTGGKLVSNPGGRARRPTIDLDRETVQELMTQGEEEERSPIDVVLIAIAIGFPLLTLIWVALIYL